MVVYETEEENSEVGVTEGNVVVKMMVWKERERGTLVLKEIVYILKTVE